MDQTSDDTLLTKASKGCRESFSALYERHQGRIYRFALQMSGNESVAGEVTQDVFLAVLDGLRHYDSARGAAVPYLMGLARYKTWRLLREQQRLELVEDVELEGCAAEAGFDIAGDRREIVEQVREAVQSLPLLYREVVVLCDLEELDYVDAAQAMGVPIGTVRSRLHRARALLLRRLSANRAERCPA